MAAETSSAAHAPSSSWLMVVRAVVLLTVALTVLLIAFAWPSVRSSVHDVPIALAGPAAATGPIRSALEQRMPGAFDIIEVADTAAAEQLIRDREVYGAIDVSSGRPQVITATAASAAIAQALQSVGTALSQAQAPSGGPAVTVRDIVPLPADDPRGAGLAAGALPLVVGGLLAAVVLIKLVSGTFRRITGAIAFAITGGLAMAAVLQFWFGSLEGSYLANTGAIALAIAATSLAILGLESLLGLAGLAIGAVIMVLIANPLSGTATAPEMLPGWSGALGQALPPGAGGQLLRSTAFFDGRGAAYPVIVLSSWLLIGVLLCVVSRLRVRHTASATTNSAPAAAATSTA